MFKRSRWFIHLFLIYGMIAHNSANQVLAVQNRPQIWWDKPEDINRVTKPNRKPQNPIPKKFRAPLLTLQWRILRLIPQSVRQFEEVHPQTVFKTYDQFRIGVTLNQSGYLYIISQEKGEDGAIIFPDSRYAYDNYVEKDKEYMAPSDIPDAPTSFVFVGNPGHQEMIIVIFSRDKIINLSDNIADNKGIVKKEIIEELIAHSGQRLTRKIGQKGRILRAGASRFAVFVQNRNRNDNEELIETIQLNHN